jgi:DNA (cytosine-5)-methyltransferase 1
MVRIIREVRPRFVFVENSPALVIRGLGRVLGDLAAMGYDARWGVFSAADVGARHQRERIWIMANAKEINHRCKIKNGDSGTDKRPKGKLGRAYFCTLRQEGRSRFSEKFSESGLERVAYDLANQVDRLGAIGNGQVPAVAALAWRMMK